MLESPEPGLYTVWRQTLNEVKRKCLMDRLDTSVPKLHDTWKMNFAGENAQTHNNVREGEASD